MTIPELLDTITQGGVVGILIIIVVGGWRRWYVWKWTYDEIVADRDWWRTTALRGTVLAEKATDVAQTSG